MRYGIPATTRASFGIYTTLAEVDALVAGSCRRCKELFGVMSLSMDSMYQQIILDHYKHPQHRGDARPASMPRCTT